MPLSFGSRASLSRECPHGSSVNFVYTPPEKRGKAYAQTNAANLCRMILASGKGFCTLFVDKANPVSNRVYCKIGFRAVEECCDYRVTTK